MLKRISVLVTALLLCLTAMACAPRGDENPATDISGLTGKVVANIGKGQTPDYVFRYILKQKGLDFVFGDSNAAPQADKVNLVYPGPGEAVGSLLAAGKVYYGIAAEPAVNTILTTNDKTSLFLNLQSLYSEASGQAFYPQAVLMVKTAFLQNNPAYVRAFVDKFAAGGQWAQNNPADAQAALSAAGSTAKGLTAESIGRSGIAFTPAADAKTACEVFFNAMGDVYLPDEGETHPLGGKTPDSGFYGSIPAADGSAALTAPAKVYAPDGAPALALAQMLHEKYADTQITVVAANLIGSKVADADIIVLPSTAAATQYNKGAKIAMLGVCTQGNLYMLKRAD